MRLQNKNIRDIFKMMNKIEILPLTSFRFIAAFYVFIFHCQIHYGVASSISIINNFISYGYLGMVMFFILSGYILSYNYKDFYSKNQIKEFYINRIARIYPIYIIYGLIGFPIFLLNVSDINSMLDLELIQIILAFFAFVFMIQSWFPTLFNIWNFGGSWSLSVEAFFYFLFPILRFISINISKRNLVIIFILSYFLASFPVLYLYSFSNMDTFSLMNTYLYSNPILRLGEFIFGITLFVLVNERNIIKYNKNLFFLLLIIFIFLLININLPSLSVLNFIFVPIVGLFILYLHSSQHNLFSNKLLVYLGKISYSFYLAQFFVFALIKTEIISFNISMINKWFLAFTITMIISIFMYHFIEIPAKRYVKSILGDK